MATLDIFQPLTGVKSRSTSLEHVDITSKQNYPNEAHREEFSSEIDRSLPCRPNPENYIRKCVYMYEDKYTFSRILQPGTLIFNSHFECGNLHSAHKIDPITSLPGRSMHSFYDLYMHEDVGSTSATAQWFFFSVSGMKAHETVTFSVRNFAKADSLFNRGMKPLMLSTKKQRQSEGKEGWVYCGVNISYSQELESTEPNNRQRNNRLATYVLTFTVIFNEPDDLCYFAYCQPYTYTDLQRFLSEKCLEHETSGLLHRSVLCQTLAGNRCELLTITSCVDALAAAELRPPDEWQCRADVISSEEESDNRDSGGELDSWRPPQIPVAVPPAPVKAPTHDKFNISLFREKIHILLTARVHPGETSGSWLVQGMIDFLLSENPAAVDLRDWCVFKIIPMLNPDGVVNGNNRTSLSGQDLNRVWDNPVRDRHPTIHHCKELARSMLEISQSNFRLYLDLHGHSRQKGVFAYGCIPDDSPAFSSLAGTTPLISQRPARQTVAASSAGTVVVNPASSGTGGASGGSKVAFGRRMRGGKVRDDQRSDSNGKVFKGLRQSAFRASPTTVPAEQSLAIPTPPPLQNSSQSAKWAGRVPELPISSLSGDGSMAIPRLIGSRSDREKRIRALPQILHKNISNFLGGSCSYSVPVSKMGTSRATMALEIGVECSYTIEASMAGGADNLHFHPCDLLTIGADICMGIHEWLQPLRPLPEQSDGPLLTEENVSRHNLDIDKESVQVPELQQPEEWASPVKPSVIADLKVFEKSFKLKLQRTLSMDSNDADKIRNNYQDTSEDDNGGVSKVSTGIGHNSSATARKSAKPGMLQSSTPRGTKLDQHDAPVAMAALPPTRRHRKTDRPPLNPSRFDAAGNVETEAPGEMRSISARVDLSTKGGKLVTGRGLAPTMVAMPGGKFVVNKSTGTAVQRVGGRVVDGSQSAGVATSLSTCNLQLDVHPPSQPSVTLSTKFSTNPPL